MKVSFKLGGLVLVPETDAERAGLAAWRDAHGGDVFAVPSQQGNGVFLQSLGPRESACREVVLIGSNSPDPGWRLISNFAPAPFHLDGRHYANVEAFWQGLKFPSESRRRAIGALGGPEARRAGESQGYESFLEYEGRRIVPGTWEHWGLMERACAAKFCQNPEAAAALLATGDRPLEHRMRRDSRSIPGVIMAEIWTRIRNRFASGDLWIDSQAPLPPPH